MLKGRENGFWLNLEKFQICIEEIVYLGHVFNKDGVVIDQNKIQAILNMSKPISKKEL